MRLLSGDGWNGILKGDGTGERPIVAFGHVDGSPWYYRQQWDYFGFAVAACTCSTAQVCGLATLLALDPGWALDGRLVKPGSIDFLIAAFIGRWRADRKAA